MHHVRTLKSLKGRDIFEQKMLKKQAEKAKLIVTRDGTVLDRKEYAQFVPKLQK